MDLTNRIFFFNDLNHITSSPGKVPKHGSSNDFFKSAEKLFASTLGTTEVVNS